MPKGMTRSVELLLVFVVIISVLLGVSWGIDLPTPALTAGQVAPPGKTIEGLPTADPSVITQNPNAAAQPAEANPTSVTATPAIVPNANVPSTPSKLVVDYTSVNDQDAPLIAQAPNTINFLLLGTDASTDQKYARTDSLMIASVNPDLPSVSLLSFPRDLVVRIPGFGEDRINTVFERGYIAEFAGGGPAFLALVLRKNFGIKIDHYVRIDFQGFIKAIDTLGGVEVLAECELHDTFPDKSSPNGKTDLDVMPGKVALSGKQALWFSRSRWSTTDFDRARRQQKVMRSVLRKVRETNMLSNAISLYGDFRNNMETDLGVTDIPALVDVAQRLTNLQIKSRVITFGIVNAHKRASDGASVLISNERTIPFIKEALSPPAGNQIRTLPVVEVYNGSTKADMELIAAERLAWEGFNVINTGKTPAPDFAETQIIVYATTSKGSPVPRLVQVFGVKRDNVINQIDPSSPTLARIVLGEDYNSCPATASMGGDVTLETDENKLLPTPTASAK